LATAIPIVAPIVVKSERSPSVKARGPRIATFRVPTTFPPAFMGIEAKVLKPASITCFRKKRRSLARSVVTKGSPERATRPGNPSPSLKRGISQKAFEL